MWFEYIQLGCGLCIAPITIQQAMMLFLWDLIWWEVLAYLDDIIILGKDFRNYIQNQRYVPESFRVYNLKLKPHKCMFFCKEVLFLGKIISEEGVAIVPKKGEVSKRLAQTSQQIQVWIVNLYGFCKLSSWPYPTLMKLQLAFPLWRVAKLDWVWGRISLCLWSLEGSTYFNFLLGLSEVQWSLHPRCWCIQCCYRVWITLGAGLQGSCYFLC